MHKTLLLLAASLIFLMPAAGQRDYRALYEHKVVTYTKMRTAGYVMTGVGGGLALTGAILLLDSDMKADDYGDDDGDWDVLGDGLWEGIGGIICAELGVGLLAGGITMASIGNRKITLYKGKLSQLSLGMVCNPKRQGLTLVYRF